MTDFISLDRVTKTYEAADGPPLSVLQDVTWAVPAGATVAVTGPSGSGKSTLLNLIGALDCPTSGTITVGGQRLDALDALGLSAYRSRQVGFIFQDHHLLPQLTALENVLLPTLGGAECAGGRSPQAHPAPGPDSGGEAAAIRPLRRSRPPERSHDLLTRVGLAERLHSFPAQLSGGERQRVAIARALMNQPPLLLCDEPTGNLDQATGGQVVALLMELAQSEGLTVVMVTHNPTHAAACRTVYELREGRLERTGGAQ